MCKRVLLLAGGAVALGMFLFGRDAASYVATSAGMVKDSVKDSVPLSFEIDRARSTIRNLEPDIRKNMHVIAKEEVEIERLEKQIAETQQRLGKDKAELMRLKTDLASGKDVFQYAGRSYTEKQVRTDLTHRFARYKTGEATLGSLQEIYDARMRGLEAARQKLENMRVAQKQLQVDVENLEARLKAVEVAQTTSNYNFDDSQLARSKALIDDLRARLQVAEKLVNAEEYLPGEISLDERSTDEIIDEVTAHFDVETKIAAASVEVE